MSDPLAALAKTLSPADPQTPVPSSASPFTIAIVATVNKDGTVTANINAATGASTVYWANASVPIVGQKIIILPSAEGVQYAIGVVGSATELPPLMKAYPVGSSWISKLSTNPATLLGFGTWVADSAGRFLVGVGTSDATYAGGTTGGASSRTIYPQYLPVSPPWTMHDTTHGHAISSGFITGTGGTGSAASAGSGAHADSTVATATGVTLNNNTGGGQALTTVPPWEAVYVFVRTA